MRTCKTTERAWRPCRCWPSTRFFQFSIIEEHSKCREIFHLKEKQAESLEITYKLDENLYSKAVISDMDRLEMSTLNSNIK
jgi:hypothetical protein